MRFPPRQLFLLAIPIEINKKGHECTRSEMLSVRQQPRKAIAKAFAKPQLSMADEYALQLDVEQFGEITMNTLKEEKVSQPNGPAIFVRYWRSAKKVRGVVVVVPGFNSHGGYYHWFASQLMDSGLAVYAVDLRGRGQSDGDRFFVDSFSEYVSDVDVVIAKAVSQHAGLPIFLFGHSAGGVVACLYALENQNRLAGLISESFAHELPAPEFALAIIKGLSHIAPHAQVLRLKNEDFSRDPEVVKAMNNDPLIAKESQPSQTLAALVRADEKLKRSFSQLNLPVLILHGSNDKAAKPNGSKYFYEHVGSTDKTLKLYDGSFHDPLNDLDRESVMRDIATWIDDLFVAGELELAVGV
jgi:acylglycerol lipase